MKTLQLKSITILTLLVSFLFTSCVDKPPHEEEKPIDLVAKTGADLEITEFGILPKFNERFYNQVDFILKQDGQYVFTAQHEVRNYKADLTKLKVSFKSNAKKVLVNRVEQTSEVSVNNFDTPITYRFLAKNGQYKEYTVSITNPANSYTGMPLVVLTTDDGGDVISRTNWKTGKFRIDKQLSNVVERTDNLEIKGRGHLTWSMEKRPYNLKLTIKDKVMGMNKHKRWVLLANHADKTLMRNKIAFEMAKRTRLAWTPDSRYVEVILNGKFLGNYLLTEQIKVDEFRVNIPEDNFATEMPGITGGYLMEIDRYWDEGYRFKPTRSQLPVMVKEPEPLNAAQQAYISNYFETVENLIYKTSPAVPDSTEYGQYIDIASFVDTWIIYEITKNEDTQLPGSLYMYKDINKKLFMGPVWDFDFTTFIGGSTFLLYDHVSNSHETAMWWAQLFKDPKFKAEAKRRWIELYPSLSTLPDFINAQRPGLKKSAEHNWAYWPQLEPVSPGRNLDMNLSWEEAVDKLIVNYNLRMTNLNTKIMAW